MTSTFISLTIIALVAAVVPLIAKLIPKQLVPEPVLLIGAGAALGPHALDVLFYFCWPAMKLIQRP